MYFMNTGQRMLGSVNDIANAEEMGANTSYIIHYYFSISVVAME